MQRLFITLICLSFFQLALANPSQHENLVGDLIGIWTVEEVQCLGGKAIHSGIESTLSPQELADYQSQIEEKYHAQTRYEFKKDGTFVATEQRENQLFSWIGKWEIATENKLKLTGFSDFCSNCEQLFDVISLDGSQFSLINQLPFNLQDDPFFVSKALVTFAIVLSRENP